MNDIFKRMFILFFFTQKEKKNIFKESLTKKLKSLQKCVSQQRGRPKL